jgi:hypothetical protein
MWFPNREARALGGGGARHIFILYIALSYVYDIIFGSTTIRFYLNDKKKCRFFFFAGMRYPKSLGTAAGEDKNIIHVQNFLLIIELHWVM